MTTPWDQAVAELAEWMKVAPGTVVPFVGAGVSRAAGLPTWLGLADALLELVHGFNLASHGELDAARSGSAVDMVTFARTRLGNEMFRRQVAKALELPRKFAPPEVAQLCWRLNDQLVVTTNLDQVLESASATVDGTAAQPLAPQDSLNAALRDPGRRVLHLHGAVTRFETWVMTESDYTAATAPTSPGGAALQTLLLDRVLLFIGYGCDDPDLHLFLDRFKDYFGRGSVAHFALMPSMPEDRRRRLLDYGIFPVEYQPSGQSHPEVEQFLDDLLTRHNPAEAERRADERRRRPVPVQLTPVPALQAMSLGQRRDALNTEFEQLYAQAASYALTDTTALPPGVKERRAETLDLLAGAWQINDRPPFNALDGREVLDDIGRGGFGVVWRVEDARTREQQALKVAHFPETDNYKFVERFKRGIVAMRRLTKRGVKNTTRYISHREVPLCVFMEYVDGGDLGTLVRNKFPMDDPGTWLRLAHEIAVIVTDSHAARVFHRDLKPSNVLVRWCDKGQPHAVLSDFDLAWFEGALSRTTTRMGDQAFASPEQLRESKLPVHVRAESDVYSLGMLILFLASQHTPTAGQWMNQHLRRDVFAAAVRKFAWLSGAHRLADLVVQCAHELPSERPAAQDVADELGALLQMETTRHAGPAEFIEEVRTRVKEELTELPGTIEHRRDNGRAVVQATYSRIQREHDDRSRFRPQGEKAVRNVQAALQNHGWVVRSHAATNADARIVVAKDVQDTTSDFAQIISREVCEGAAAWLVWA